MVLVFRQHLEVVFGLQNLNLTSLCIILVGAHAKLELGAHGNYTGAHIILMSFQHLEAIFGL